MEKNYEQLMIKADGDITPAEKKFVELHKEILFCGNSAQVYAIKMAAKLKEMRDGDLYKEAGFETFGEYTENALGLKERQAYNYIKVYEDLPENFLHSNAKIGITKLLLLTSVPESEREVIADKIDIKNSSVSELKKKLAELTKINEQLTLDLENKNVEVAEPPQVDIEAVKAEIRESEIANIKKQVKAEADAKTDAEMKAFRDELIIAKREKKEAADKLKAAEDAANKAKAEADTAKKAAAEAQELQKKLDAVTAEKEAQEKAIKVSSNPTLTKFKFLFENLQTEIIEIKKTMSGMDEETKTKCAAALKKVMEGLMI